MKRFFRRVFAAGAFAKNPFWWIISDEFRCDAACVDWLYTIHKLGGRKSQSSPKDIGLAKKETILDIDIDDVPTFKPCSFTCSESLRTEIILEDGFVVWEQWGTEGVQVGYNEKGLLVGVQSPEVLKSNRHT